MQRLFHDQPIPDELRGAIIALGNFDGFHLGHQAVVGRAVQRGAHERRPVIVATFDPHPVRHFKPDTPPFRLTTLDQRQRLFGQAGADAMLVFNFGAELASTTAEGFVAGILADRFGAAGVVTGEDFTFGKGRGGNAQVLRDLGAQHGIGAETVEAVMLDGNRISSGLVREALQAGISFDGPGGKVTSQKNMHMTKNVFIGETKADGQFKILKEYKDVAGEPWLKGTFKPKTAAK